jgi:hypothetical protein
MGSISLTETGFIGREGVIRFLIDILSPLSPGDIISNLTSTLIREMGVNYLKSIRS